VAPQRRQDLRRPCPRIYLALVPGRLPRGWLEILGTEPDYGELVQFCWNVPIDVSEAHSQLPEPSLIAREAPKGGYQVRCHYNLRALPGPEEERHQRFIDQWVTLVRQADEQARVFRVEPGEIAVIDNYRMLHGRRAYKTPERRVALTWAWTDQAFGVPSEQPDFDRPEALLGES
jgi:hypothetical protein